MLIILLLLILALFIYSYITKNHDYWQKRNVKYERPIPIFGNLFQNVIGKKSTTEMATEWYKKYPNERVVGLYHGTVPELLIRDLDLVRKILNIDHAYFYPRGLGRDPKKEPLFVNLFHVDGDSWKLLRQRLTPAFTTAKLKRMFPLIVECAEKLQIVGENIVNNGGNCDVRELMARFTTEFIGACGFGLQLDSITNENSPFRNYGKLIFNRNRSWGNIALVLLYDLFPDFRGLLQTILYDPIIFKTSMELLENVRSQRNYKPSGRHDFIDLLMELAEKGTMTGESIEKKGPDGSPVQIQMEMDPECMAAQVFIFFAAGFETSSSATSYLLHELAFNPEKQKKIQENIDQVLAKYNNKLCFDSIAEMTYLSMAFKEAMRKFPSLGTLHRICAKRYTIPELGITLDPGVKIIIPVQGIQNDEQYFENPTQFIPERFANEVRNKFTYLPFGEGPRMCIDCSYNIVVDYIQKGKEGVYSYPWQQKQAAYSMVNGARLGEMQSLAGLAALLHKFSVEPDHSTKRVPEVSHVSNTVQSIKGGLPLKLKLRQKSTGVAA